MTSNRNVCYGLRARIVTEGTTGCPEYIENY